MATPEAPLPHLHSTQPLGRNETRITETTYAFPSGRADMLSPMDYDAYAVERMYGADSPVTEQYNRTGKETVREWHRDGWLISPRLALIGTVVLTAAANLGLLDGVRLDNKPVGRIIPDAAGRVITGAGNLIGDAESIIDASQQSGLTEVVVNPPTSAGTPRRRTFSLRLSGEEQHSGIAQPDAITVDELVMEIKADQSTGRIDRVTIEGEASDEWLLKGESSLGVPDIENQALAAKRANVVTRATRALLRRDHVKGVTVKTEAVEKLLDSSGLGDLLLSVNEYGYSSITSAIIAYNRGAKMPRSLRQTIKQTLGGNRTDIAVLESSERPVPIKPQPGSSVEHKTAAHEHKHKSPLKLPFELIPLVPVPWMRRSIKNLFSASPQVADEVPDKVWIELFQEAMPGRSNELVDDAWALTRKYQLLLRDERIQQVTRFDYKDAKGDDRSFRVGFVDHVPTPEALAAVEEIMKKVSFMRDGKVAERLNAIMIFPSENTGRQHPKKIGLGIDEQYASDVLGVAIPTIGLVELHMPTEPTPEQIRGYRSMSWTLAHEVAGHFTDVLDASPTLRRVHGGEKGLRNFEASNSWAGAGDNGFAKVGQRSKVSISGRQFAIPGYPEHYVDGRRTSEVLVPAGDARLRDAAFVRLQRMGPTAYADTSAAENYAETAANATTGSPIPFEQAGVVVQDATAEGYHVDAGLLFDFVTRIGSLSNQDREGLGWARQAIDRIEASWRRRDIDINQDPQLNRNSEFAKNNRYQQAKRRLRILAGARD